MKVKHVKMIMSSRSNEFVDEINEALNEGYELQGNMSMEGSTKYQLMVLKNDDTKDALADLLRNVIGDVNDMQEDGCTDHCHKIAFNLQQMYSEILE